MAVYAGANTGSRAAHEPNDAALAGAAFGVSASMTLVAATSQNMALPVDANSKLYPAYQIIADASCWFNFSSTSGDVAAVAGANNYLVNGSGLPVIVATPQVILNGGAGAGAFLAAISTPGGHINVTGLF